MNKEVLDTEYITFQLEEGVLHATYKSVEVTEDIAKEVVKTRKAYCDYKTYPHLLMETSVAKITKEARDYFATDESTEGVAAGAIIVKSAFKMTLLNFFLKVSKPEVPARLFTNKEDAIQWLQDFKTTNN